MTKSNDNPDLLRIPRRPVWYWVRRLVFWLVASPQERAEMVALEEENRALRRELAQLIREEKQALRRKRRGK